MCNLLQYHLPHRPLTANETVPNVQEPLPRFVSLQVVQLVSFVELSTVSSLVLSCLLLGTKYKV